MTTNHFQFCDAMQGCQLSGIAWRETIEREAWESMSGVQAHLRAPGGVHGQLSPCGGSMAAPPYVRKCVFSGKCIILGPFSVWICKCIYIYHFGGCKGEAPLTQENFAIGRLKCINPGPFFLV